MVREGQLSDLNGCELIYLQVENDKKKKTKIEKRKDIEIMLLDCFVACCSHYKCDPLNVCTAINLSSLATASKVALNYETYREEN